MRSSVKCFSSTVSHKKWEIHTEAGKSVIEFLLLQWKQWRKCLNLFCKWEETFRYLTTIYCFRSHSHSSLLYAKKWMAINSGYRKWMGLCIITWVAVLLVQQYIFFFFSVYEKTKIYIDSKLKFLSWKIVNKLERDNLARI